MSSIVPSSSSDIDEGTLKNVLLDGAAIRPIIVQLAREANRDERLTLVTPKDVFHRLAEHLKISPLYITSNADVKAFIKQLSREVVTEVAEGNTREEDELPVSGRRKRRTPDIEESAEKQPKTGARVKKKKTAEDAASSKSVSKKREGTKSPKAKSKATDPLSESLQKLTRLSQALGRGPNFYKGLPPKTEPAQRLSQLKQRLLDFAKENKIGKAGSLPTLQEAKKWKEDEETKDELRSLGLHRERDGQLKERNRRVAIPKVITAPTSSSDSSEESNDSSEESNDSSNESEEAEGSGSSSAASEGGVSETD